VKITKRGGPEPDPAPGGFAVDGALVLGALCERGILGGPLSALEGVDLEGGAIRFDNGSALGVVLLGGAIIIDRGSFDAGIGVDDSHWLSLESGVVGGGASGFATSCGSSPGKIHRFIFSS
jgi:hypothetical protein